MLEKLLKLPADKQRKFLILSETLEKKAGAGRVVAKSEGLLG